MSADRIAWIRDFYDAVLKGDIARAESYFAADRLVIREAESLPYGGVYHGVEGYRQLMRGLVAVWKHVRFENFSFAVGEGLIIARFTMSAIGRATNIDTSFPVVEAFDIEEDRIVAIAPYYWDTHAMRQALGTA